MPHTMAQLDSPARSRQKQFHLKLKSHLTAWRAPVWIWWCLQGAQMHLSLVLEKTEYWGCHCLIISLCLQKYAETLSEQIVIKFITASHLMFYKAFSTVISAVIHECPLSNTQCEIQITVISTRNQQDFEMHRQAPYNLPGEDEEIVWISVSSSPF